MPQNLAPGEGRPPQAAWEYRLLGHVWWTGQAWVRLGPSLGGGGAKGVTGSEVGEPRDSGTLRGECLLQPLPRLQGERPLAPRRTSPKSGWGAQGPSSRKRQSAKASAHEPLGVLGGIWAGSSGLPGAPPAQTGAGSAVTARLSLPGGVRRPRAPPGLGLVLLSRGGAAGAQMRGQRAGT